MANNYRNRKPRNSSSNRNRHQSNSPKKGNLHGKNRRYKMAGPDSLFQKYINLLDQHLIARRKYFEFFYTSKSSLFKKLKDNFYKSLEQLRNYEKFLRPKEREMFQNKINNRGKLDTSYSEEMPPVDSGPLSHSDDPEKLEEIHLLPTQKESNYKEDTEESVGSMEDYQKYKGL